MKKAKVEHRGHSSCSKTNLISYFYVNVCIYEPLVFSSLFPPLSYLHSLSLSKRFRRFLCVFFIYTFLNIYHNIYTHTLLYIKRSNFFLFLFPPHRFIGNHSPAISPFTGKCAYPLSWILANMPVTDHQHANPTTDFCVFFFSF